MTSFHKFCIEQGYGVDEEFLLQHGLKDISQDIFHIAMRHMNI